MFSNKGFPQDRAITHAGMLWLLAAQLVVMLPLMFYLPVWLLPLLVFSAVWRLRAMQGKVEQPGILVKVLLALFGIGAIKLSGLPMFSLEMTASLLTLGFAYKSLEVINRRDGMVVILTGFVLIGVLFLFDQSIMVTLYSIIALTILTAAMVAIQQNSILSANQSAWQSLRGTILSNLRLAAGMLALCLPLMLLFFLFAPRFQPFWVVPSAGGQAKTGITDSMSPGDIANLSQSDKLAFSASFSRGARPAQTELYWRGLVMEYFDGVTWTANDPETPPRQLDELAWMKNRFGNTVKDAQNPIEQRGEPLEYTVIYQRTGQPWLFALTPVTAASGSAVIAPDFRVVAQEDILEPMFVRYTSYPKSIKQPVLDEVTRKINLSLPETGNAKSRLLAQQLFAQSDSKVEYIQRVLNRFREQQYFYTLRPPLLGKKDTIDGFLIDSKKGFCAHYSGSFVFMMRAVGIPARVVAGYQGGEWNTGGNFLSVRQFDAHAWTEVWLEGKGWQRIDPTAMVAPERIEQNLEAAMQEEGSFLEGQLVSLNKFKWLSGLRQQLEYLQYGWQRFVLNFDSDTQQNLLQKLFGEMTIQKTIMIVSACFGGILLLWVGFLGMTKKRRSEAIQHQLYRRFCRRLAKRGVHREPAQTPDAFRQTAAAKLPDLATQIDAFTQHYLTLCYHPNAAENAKQHLQSMRQLLKAF